MGQIISLLNLYPVLTDFKKNAKKIVLVTGCFDILHSAHEQFLYQAKLAGNVLLVGLETDVRVKILKGKGRPVNSWQKRAQKLAALKTVDYVFPLPENLADPGIQKALIVGIKPSILAVSSHTSFLDQKKTLVEKAGGKLKVVLLQDKNISTSILTKI